MGFLSSKVTMTRFQVHGSSPEAFGQEHLDSLAENRIGRQKIASMDGVETGWTASKHILDIDFNQEKNVIGDVLFFSIRIDQTKLPSDLLRAYYEIDLKALSANSRSGFPSKMQKREAKETARDRLEHEAKDGRYLKMKSVECAWDRQTGELWVATNSAANIDRIAELFDKTFGQKIEQMSAGSIAAQHGDLDKLPLPEIEWIEDSASHNWLGNEFLVWLWWRSSTGKEIVKNNAGDLTFMLGKTLTMDDPRGQSGDDVFKHEMPITLPEAKKAIQTGKLPRKSGVVIARNGQDFGLTISAESLSISGGTLPAAEEERGQAQRIERVDNVRTMLENLDLLYGEFCSVRLSPEWETVRGEIKNWIGAA